MNQKGFIPIAVLIGILLIGVIGTAFYVKQQQNNSNTNTGSASQENVNTSPSPSTTNNSPIAKSTPSPTSKSSTKPSPTSTKAPTNTPNPTNNNSNNTSNPTNTPAPTNTPTPQPTTVQPTPTPTPIFSNAKPVLTVSSVYTIGDSGPCFDLSSKHPYNYTQSANYKFDENESSWRYTSLRDDGYSGKATVCWVKDPSKTGQQYVFKAKSYVDVSGHDPIYSDEVSVTYTHP